MNKSTLTALALAAAPLLTANAQRPAPQHEAAPAFGIGDARTADLNALRQRPAAPHADNGELKPLRRMAAPQAAAQDAFDFFGSLSYSSNWDAMTDGMYSLTPETQAELAFGYKGMGWTFETIDPQWGWIENGQLHLANIVTAMSQIYVYEMYTIDLATYQVTDMQDVLPELNSSWMHPFMEIAAYNPNDGFLYGYGSSQDGTGYAFTRANASDVADAEVIIDLDWSKYSDRCLAMCYNPNDNMLYGVNNRGNMCRTDLQGNQTQLAKNPLQYRLYKATSGMVMDADNNCVYVNLTNSNDYSSYLYRYDIDSDSFELCLQYDYDNTFLCMTTSKLWDNPALPRMPRLTADTFGAGSLDGSLSFLVPSEMGGGTAITGDVTMIVTVDGTPVADASYAPGSTATFDLTLSQGMHDIKAVARAEGSDSRPFYNTRWYGNDVPVAPEIKSLKDGVLSWYPVTKGLHGGYLDTASMQYRVYRNGEEVEGSPLTGTSLSVTIPEDLPYTSYTFTVAAESAGLLSETTASEPVCAGVPYTPDVVFIPTADQVNAFTTVPLGEYYPDWFAETKENGEIWFNSNFDNWDPMGNFLITPPIALDDTNHYYSFSVLSAIANEWGDEDCFEAWIGTEPTAEAMTLQILGTTKPEILWNEGGREVSNIFAIETPGTYYVGIKCTSPINQAGVMVRNIAVSKTAQSLGGPAALENMSGVAAEKGVLTADVTFTFPTKRANGQDFDPSTVLTGTIMCVNQASATGHPGETKTVTVKTEQGVNSIEGVCSLDGEESPVVSFDLYTGVDIPVAITDLKAEVTEDGRGVHLSWTPPTEALNGGYVDPAKYYYRINCMEHYEYVYEAVSEYTYYPPVDEQKFWYVHVDAYSAAGRSSEFHHVRVLMGAPYEIPSIETFTGCELHYAPLMAAAGQWGIVNPTQYVTNTDSEDNAVLLLLGNDGNGEAWLPMYSTEGCDAVDFTACIFNHPSLTPACTLSAMTYGMDTPEVIGTFSTAGTGWTDCSLALPEKFCNRPWVRFFFNVPINSNQAWMLDRYTVAPASGVKGMAGNGIKVSRVAGGLEVAGAKGVVTVYTVDGRIAAKAEGESLRFRLDAGIYVVAAGGHTVKVTVK